MPNPSQPTKTGYDKANAQPSASNPQASQDVIKTTTHYELKCIDTGNSSASPNTSLCIMNPVLKSNISHAARMSPIDGNKAEAVRALLQNSSSPFSLSPLTNGGMPIMHQRHITLCQPQEPGLTQSVQSFKYPWRTKFVPHLPHQGPYDHL
ncbi:hypothetical protein DSO57_1023182 [Entomophthora muscae]|uniref:Uncharacterized protein n=1 Tax=Entomophthora muscae TaxID=34485 RepID=A0ACC2T393_9FUNG|nr:hypothetical protein DSO57_1023182 [Entomophthora muscae]